MKNAFSELCKTAETYSNHNDNRSTFNQNFEYECELDPAEVGSLCRLDYAKT